MSYFPLDREILSSSIWALGTPEQKTLWVYMMLKADVNTGIVADSDPGIAVGAGLPLDVTLACLEYLKGPDPHSRTKDHDGRKIIPLDGGGYKLVTYEKHRDKDYSTERVKRYRERQKELLDHVETKRYETDEHVTETDETRFTVTETTNTNPNPDPDPDPDQRMTDERMEGAPPPQPAVGQATIEGLREQVQKAKRPRSEVAAEEAARVAAAFMDVFNATFGRKLSTTPMLTSRIAGRLKDGYAGWQLIAQPLLVCSNSEDRAFLKTVQPEWLLRDGKRPRTQDGRTTGAVDWVERELQRIDRTWLSPRLAHIATEAGIIDILMAHGVQVRE